MAKKIFVIIFVVISCFAFSGCQSYSRKIADAENTIDELKRSDAERAIEYSRLEGLYNRERAGNTALRDINGEIQGKLDGYTESERRRIEAEREILENLEGIFSSGQGIIDQLIEGYEEIRKFISSLEKVE